MHPWCIKAIRSVVCTASVRSWIAIKTAAPSLALSRTIDMNCT